LGEIDRSPGRFQLLAKHRLSSTGIGSQWIIIVH
jgi:hypothetical protein